MLDKCNLTGLINPKMKDFNHLINFDKAIRHPSEVECGVRRKESSK
jgi:hypothetical protein